MDQTALTEPTTGALELGTALAQAGLGQYEERLRENGFLDLEDVSSITETDMAQMGFRLGDRRKLQRVIREYNNSNPTKHPTRTTRAYRRHPRPDANAPTRPKTGYVLFGKHLRKDPSLGNMSFTELARETGKRWKEVSVAERDAVWDGPAAQRMKEYREHLDRYKETEDYRNHQKYLDDFKHAQTNSERIESSDLVPSPTPELASSNNLSGSHTVEHVSASRRESADDEDQDMSQDPPGPVNSGMEEVRRISRNLGINPHLTRVAPFPQEDITTKAVEAFLQGTGSLIYFWKYEEALDMIKSVYHQQGNSTQIHSLDIFAMATVGSCCDGEADTKTFQRTFMSFFLYMLSSFTNISELRRMRLFASLAICRFTNSAESARQLILSALDIGRQTFTSPSFTTETSHEEKRYWWNVFRSIVFLESWFAYNTGFAPRITTEDLTKRLLRNRLCLDDNSQAQLYQPSHPSTDEGLGIFHERIFQLGHLASYAALDLKEASQPNATRAQHRLDSLNQWHRTLPPPMHLSRISLADPFSINKYTKRSLLLLHIIFLGLFIEPYRNCLIQLGNFRLGNNPIDAKELEALVSVEEQCIVAARQSARVASLLQIDGLIRSHCWVLVYTSFVGCAILLFSASQKMLTFSAEEVGLDMSYASSHINVLSLCSHDNDTARKLYTPLQTIFIEIREVLGSPGYRRMREERGNGADAAPESPAGATMVDIARRVMGVLMDRLSF